MNKDEYERKKEELKARKARAARELEQARGGKPRVYAVAVNKYTAAQEALNEFIRENGIPQPTRNRSETAQHKFVRASGESICKSCCRKYYAHPQDLNTLDHQNRPFLRILCNGLRVKL